MFSKAKITQLKAKFSSIDTNDISDSGLRAKAAKLKAKQGGFTLLELLVVVAILAAIAGTATIALQDTDARASAAAHVTMMDELNKGIRTFRVLNKNVLPTGYDSLIATATTPVAATPVTGSLISIAAIADVSPIALTAEAVAVLDAGGIKTLQYIDESLDDGDANTPACDDLAGIVGSRANAYVAGNIFMTPGGNGCGVTRTLEAGDQVMFWTGGQERLVGQPPAAAIIEFDGANVATATGKAFMTVGLGPASDLFNANQLGGLTSVPVYRHVSGTEYGRFMAIFDVGSFNAAGSITAGDQVSLTAIVDGAGDTKEEELGEWDGTRNTI
jgi:prepilin-type N-terminal cleavage/methylation domain-containing protein